MAASTEHLEVWYTDNVGDRRHRIAHSVEDATAIAIEHSWAGDRDVTVERVTVTSVPVVVTIPPKPEPEEQA